jgi:serine/threonine protein kinase
MGDRVGQTIGRYKLKELVGRRIASTGPEPFRPTQVSIYKSFDDISSRWVAIKVISLEDSQRDVLDSILADFQLEFQAIAALRHPNILTIYQYGEQEGSLYIVMEYVPGGSLQDRIDTGKPFTWEQALAITIPISQALVLAHDQGIIHHCIKPTNILMPQDYWPMLADFLQWPIIFGRHVAPEYFMSADDARIDIYALGTVLYELLTGRFPFERGTSFATLMTRSTEPPLPLLAANPAGPPVFESILDKALAQDPAEGYQTMADFSQVLIDARTQLSRSFTQDAGRHPTISTTRQQLKKTKISLKQIACEQHILPPDQAELIVGRASKNKTPDIDLAPYKGFKAGVSRRHSRLLRQDDQWFVEDLASTNGTFVNGVKIPPHQTIAIHRGDILRFGRLELEFRLEA